MDSPEILWDTASFQYPLAVNEVHIWRVPLLQTDSKTKQLTEILSPDERIRVGRFHFERDRRRFTISRGMLRILLGHYGSACPEQIRFQYNFFGKPGLAEGTGDFSICFNLSHSHEMALFAFTKNRKIGIDLEYVRPLPDAEIIAARTFAAGESAAIRALPEEQRLAAFFHCWTRKEAYIKALGDGLSRPLDDFEVIVTPGEPPRLLSVGGVPDGVDDWSFHAFSLEAGYIAALAVAGRNLQFLRFCIS